MEFPIILCLLFSAVYAKHEGYIGYKSYFVGPASLEQLKEFGNMINNLDLEILSHPLTVREGIVLVKPAMLEEFSTQLEKLNVPFRVHTENVKAALDTDDELIASRRQEIKVRNGGKLLPYNDYQDWNTIEQYLIDIANRYPNLVTLVRPAKSFEGRDLIYFKISTTNFQNTSKPLIVIDGGVHAREWITPPAVTWAIHKLVEDNTEPDLLRDFDWILFPVVNPDGYHHTFVEERFWRKTRSNNTNNLAYICAGVDGNRNFDFSWASVGISWNPCTETYPGNEPFSEIEIRAVRDIIQENLSRIALYITMHSYGSMILYPWGHDGSLSNNHANLDTVARAMADAIDNASRPDFVNYLVGNAVTTLGYGAAGAGEDYAHSVGVPLSYTFELPSGVGNPGGLQGFNLDPIYIQQVVEETWAGIVIGARRAGQLFV